MKPEIIVQDFGGIHNSDLNKTQARLIKGGSWKRQNIVVIIPAGKSIPAKVALSHWNLMFPPNNGVCRILAQGMEVGEAYSTAIESVLNHPILSTYEYILTIEHDNAPPQDGVIRLIEAMEKHPEFSAISGNYFTKGPGGQFQGWGDPSDPILNFRPQIPKPNTIQEVNGLGMGFCLFRMGIFKDKKIPKPWFKTLGGKEGCMTQDLYFWKNARQNGYRCAIDVECRVGHYDLDGNFGPPDTMW